MTPVWLLDIDGVINATGKPQPNGYDMDDWHTGKADADGHTWPINWSAPVVKFISMVHESGLAEIRWHTTWQEWARTSLAPLVGLPDFPVAYAPEFEHPGGHAAKAIAANRPDWWKLPAAERVVRDERRPLIWTDDDITWSLRRYNVDTEMRAYAPALLVSPGEHTGLTKKQLRQISDFLALHRLAVTA